MLSLVFCVRAYFLDTLNTDSKWNMLRIRFLSDFCPKQRMWDK